MAASSGTPFSTPENLLATVGPDVDRGQSLMALYLALSIVAFLFTLGRLGIRVRARNVGADDITSIVAAIVYMGIAACVSVGAVSKTYRHIEYLTVDQAILAVKLNTIEQVLLTITASLGRIAIALMILRIIGVSVHKWRRRFLWGLVVVTAVVGVISVIVPWLQCRNPAAIWDISIRPSTTCWAPSAIVSEIMFLAVWHVAAEFILALYPTLLLWHLKISKGKKIALCILLGLGCLTGIFSAIKTDQGRILSTALDVTFDQYYLQVFFF